MYLTGMRDDCEAMFAISSVLIKLENVLRSLAADPGGYCAAAAVRVSRKAGMTSFAKRSRSAS